MLGAAESLRMPGANSALLLLVRRLLLTYSEDALMNCPACKMSLREKSLGDFAVDIAEAVACIQSSSRASDAPTHA